jgi:hypothetical protein
VQVCWFRKKDETFRVSTQLDRHVSWVKFIISLSHCEIGLAKYPIMSETLCQNTPDIKCSDVWSAYYFFSKLK